MGVQQRRFFANTIGDAGNKALSFNGIDEAVSLGDPANLDFVVDFSINLWVKVIGVGNEEILSHYGSAPATNQSFLIQCASTNNLVIVALDSTGQKRYEITTGMQGAWHMVTATYANNDLQIYLDASQANLVKVVDNTIGSLRSPAIDWLIGARQTLYGEFLADVPSFWNVVLSGAEVTELYNGGVPLNPLVHSQSANLVSSYDFNNNIKDKKDSNNGTFINMDGSNYSTDIP